MKKKESRMPLCISLNVCESDKYGVKCFFQISKTEFVAVGFDEKEFLD